MVDHEKAITYYKAYQEYGSARKAGKAIGVSHTVILRAKNLIEGSTSEKPKDGKKRLYFDVETSPNIGLFWRSGYKMNIGHENIIHERAIICICWKWEGSEDVHALTWDESQCDKSMLEEFVKIADSADQVVGHNGDRFDMKWFKTRCLFHRIQTKAKYDTIDTLKISRSQFYFNSNRLDYIGKFLGFGGKKDTGGFNLWKDIVLNNCPESMALMVDYCKRDVELLEKVHVELKKYVEPSMHRAVLTGGHKFDCPECGSDQVKKHGIRATKAGTIKHRMRCSSCGTHFTISNKVYTDMVQKRIDDGLINNQ